MSAINHGDHAAMERRTGVRFLGVTALGRRYGWICPFCKAGVHNVPRETAEAAAATHQCPEPTPTPPKSSQERTAAYRARKKEQA